MDPAHTPLHIENETVTNEKDSLAFIDECLQESFREATVCFESNPQKSVSWHLTFSPTALTADSQTAVMGEGSHLDHTSKTQL